MDFQGIFGILGGHISVAIQWACVILALPFGP